MGGVLLVEGGDVRGEWLATLSAHVDELDKQWDLGKLYAAQALDPDMLSVARNLSRVLSDSDGDLATWHTLGMFYMYRAMAHYGQDDDGAEDGKAMSDAFDRCFIAGLEIPEQMRLSAAIAAAETAREMCDRATQSPDPEPFTAAARLWQRIIAATPGNFPLRAEFLRGLSATLCERFLRTRDPADLDAAIAIGQQAAQTADADDEGLPRILAHLADTLTFRFGLTSAESDLDTAIGAYRQAVRGASPGRPWLLSKLGNALRVRFEWSGDDADLGAAVAVGQQAVEEAGEEDEDLPGILRLLGDSLMARFARAGAIADLDAGIAALRRAMNACSAGEPGLAVSLADLGSALHVRYQRTGARDDVDAAVAFSEQAVAASADDDSDRGAYLMNLGTFLMSRADDFGNQSDAAAATVFLREAVAAFPAGHRNRALALSNLSSAVRAKFAGPDGVTGVNEAITLLREAIAESPAGDPRLPVYLRNLAVALDERYGRTAVVADLDEAIAVGRRTLELIPEDHPELAVFLSDLGGSLLARCDATHQADGLGEAIAVNRQAVAAIREGDPDEASIRVGLADALEELFEQADDRAALDEAIAVYQQAAQAPASGTVNRGRALLGLGRTLLVRLEQHGPAEPAGLGHAVTVLRQALAAVPPGQVNQPLYQAELGKALRMRFAATGEQTDLDEALALSQSAVDATPASHVNLGRYRANLAEAQVARDGDGRQDARATATVPGRAELIATVAAHLERIDPADLSPALELGAVADVKRLAELLDGEDNPDVDTWGMVGLFQWFRYLALVRASEEDEAAQDEALDAAIHAYVPRFIADRPVPERLRPAVAEEVSDEVLPSIFRQALGKPDAVLLTRLLSLGHRVLAALADDEPDIVAFQSLFGGILSLRYAVTGEALDLEEGIGCLREVIAIAPAGHETLSGCQALLSNALLNRFLLTGDPAELAEAIALGQLAVEASSGDPFQEACRAHLGYALVTRSRVTGSEADLGAGICMLVRSTGVIPTEDGDRPLFLAYLSDALLTRHERTGSPADLDQAVSTAAEAVQTCPDGHPNVGICVNNLGIALMTRAVRDDADSDLDRAIDLFERGIEAVAPSLSTHGQLLLNLSLALLTSGKQAVLDAAIDAGRRGLAETPAGSLVRARGAGALSSALLGRFAQSGSQADLDEAAAVGEAGIAAITPGHPDTAMLLANQGVVLRARFERTTDQRYLEQSIELLRQALAACAVGSPERPRFLTELSAALVARFQVTGEAVDLDEAIDLARQAVRALTLEGLNESSSLAQLGTALHLRATASRDEAGPDEADLDEAAGALRRAVEKAGGAQWAENTMALGAVYETRFERTGAAADAVEAIARYGLAAGAEAAAPAFRISAARVGAELAAPWVPERAAALLADAVRLLPLTAPRQLTRSDQQHALSRFAFLASDAAALTLEAGGPDGAARALGLLELGRGVLQAQALDTRGDLTGLYISHPALAGEFLTLRDQLDAPDVPGLTGVQASLARADAVPSLGQARMTAHRDRHTAAAQFAGLLERIRGQAGFEAFLLPPQPDELSRQAARGPIVVFNVSRYRSDAIIVTAEEITGIPLPDLSFAAVVGQVRLFNDALDTGMSATAERANRMRSEEILNEILEWLWEAAAAPVLRQLGHAGAHEDGQPWPRVWWVPGGLLGMLPLHAAGYHRSGTGETVLDRVISSYTPTIRELAHAREHAGGWAVRRSLIVAMPTTPGQNPLPNVAAEAAMLQERLPMPALLIERPDAPAGSAPTKDTVAACLPDADVVHFSCHGYSHPGDPSQSLLLLHDYQENPFTVASLLPVRLQHAQLAFLSACQTARNAATDLLDEGIHLASAFQLAGYPHVIGTLWTIYDKIAVDVARAFYAGLETSWESLAVSGSAEALHHAIRDLRDNRGLAAVPSQWAAYLHTGA